MVLETLENGIIGKLYWKHWKVELLENGIGNIGKWYWKHWKMSDWKMKLLENGIGFIRKWNRIFQKME